MKQKKDDAEVCTHCLTPLSSTFTDTIITDDAGHAFCCHGCEMAYQMVHSQGLEFFYQVRQGWRPGPPDGLLLDLAIYEAKCTIENPNRYSIYLSLADVRCASCIWLVENLLLKQEGVLEARGNYSSHTLRLSWNPQLVQLSDLLQLLVQVGYSPRPYTPGETQASMDREKRDILLRFGTAAFLSMQLMIATLALYAGYFQGMSAGTKRMFQLLTWLLATPVVFYSGFPFLRSSWLKLRQRHLTMDILVSLGALSSYLFSVLQIAIGGEVYFDTCVMIITFLLLGRYIEANARSKAHHSLTSMFEILPSQARLEKDDGKTVLVPLEQVRVKDKVQVHPGERIAFDGWVSRGDADVDESWLTGESMPQYKSVGAKVFAGSYNRNGTFTFVVEKTAGNTALAAVANAVNEAQARKAPVQLVADRVVGYFIPSVLFFAGATFTFLLINGTSLSNALMRAVAILVVACPCALGLATPLVIILATAKAAQNNVLVKGGDVIESITHITAVLFDKTGTITSGTMKLTDCYPPDISHSERMVLSALEAKSSHPVARAVVTAFAGESGEVPQVSDFRELPGKGVSGLVENQRYFVGNARYLAELEVPLPKKLKHLVEEWAAQGKAALFLATSKGVLGAFAIQDRIKADSREVIRYFSRQRITTFMLSGDTSLLCQRIATECGIEAQNVFAELSPLEKQKVVRRMKTDAHSTLMVGDGINDAPALTEAHVGIAMGKASDIALESADAVVLGSQLTPLAHLHKIACKAYRLTKQNLWWAFSYNIIAIPLAMTGFLHPIFSALAMAVSSVVVVLNSLRLLRLKGVY